MAPFLPPGGMEKKDGKKGSCQSGKSCQQRFAAFPGEGSVALGGPRCPLLLLRPNPLDARHRASAPGPWGAERRLELRGLRAFRRHPLGGRGGFGREKKTSGRTCEEADKSCGWWRNPMSHRQRKPGFPVNANKHDGFLSFQSGAGQIHSIEFMHRVLGFWRMDGKGTPQKKKKQNVESQRCRGSERMLRSKGTLQK